MKTKTNQLFKDYSSRALTAIIVSSLTLYGFFYLFVWAIQQNAITIPSTGLSVQAAPIALFFNSAFLGIALQWLKVKVPFSVAIGGAIIYSLIFYFLTFFFGGGVIHQVPAIVVIPTYVLTLLGVYKATQ